MSADLFWNEQRVSVRIPVAAHTPVINCAAASVPTSNCVDVPKALIIYGSSGHIPIAFNESRVLRTLGNKLLKQRGERSKHTLLFGA